MNFDNNKLENEIDIENASINEIDPRLRFDAFTAGMKAGGLRSVTTIQLLVCYVVANLNGKVTARNIIDAVDEGMLANHFEISDAISKLTAKKAIVENENGTLTLVENDKEMIDIIERDLPITVREAAITLCQKAMAKETYMRENKVETRELDDGKYEITLHISDGDTDFFKLTLYTGSIEQAELIRDKFITNPVKVYENLINGIFCN